MTKHIEKAYAKINLTLDVLGKRADGYHELLSVMQTLTFCDALTLTFNDSCAITTRSNLRYLPTDNRNLTVAAAHAYYQALGVAPQGLHIGIGKRIPVCAGLGGGSSDAAAVLRGLNHMHDNALSAEALLSLAADIGSDVAFCIHGGTQLARGRGELLSPLPSPPPCTVVLCKPPVAVSTAAIFKQLNTNDIAEHPDTDAFVQALHDKDLSAMAKHMRNVLASDALFPDNTAIITTLTRHGALGAVMSGSGPTVFGLFDDLDNAVRAANVLRRRYKEVYTTGIKERLP